MADASSPPQNILDIAPSLRERGFRLIDAGELYNLFSSFMAIIAGVAAAGTNQATATPIGPGVTVVSTVATGAGVVLPTGLPGQTKTVVNTSANALLVYGNGGDQIIPLASSTPAASLSVPAGETAQLVAVTRTVGPPPVTTWKVVSLG